MAQPHDINRLLVEHGEFLRRLARQLVGTPGADDAVQDTWLAALRQPPHRINKPRQWLSTVLRHSIRSGLRAQGRRRRREEIQARLRHAPEPSLELERTEIVERVARAVRGLSRVNREVIALRFYEGLPPREIARRMGIPVETAKSRQQRALRELRLELEREGGDDWRVGIATCLGIGTSAQKGTLAMASAGFSVRLSVVIAALLLVAGVSIAVLYGEALESEDEGVHSGAAYHAPLTDIEQGTRPELAASGKGRLAPDHDRVSVRPSPAREALPSPHLVARAPAVLVGRVIDGDEQEPIPEALVVLRVPAEDMQCARLNPDATRARAWTDPRGEFRIEVDLEHGASSASIDATAAGYGSLYGPYNCGGAAESRVSLKPGRETHVTIRLRPHLYVAGTVVDDLGDPVPGVTVTASDTDDDSTAYIAFAKTDQQGRFEVFDFESEGRRRANLTFEHREYLETAVPDCRKLAVEERASLRIVMHRGLRVEGTVWDAHGSPAPGVLIEVLSSASQRLTAGRADKGGNFVIEGVPRGLVRYRAIDIERQQKASMEAELHADSSGLDIEMKQLELPPAKSHTLLDLGFVTISPALRSAYELTDRSGVMVQKGSSASGFMRLGGLRSGDCMLSVGGQDISTVEEAVGAILKSLKDGQDSVNEVRVVYLFRRESGAGSMTTSMILSDQHVRELRAWLAAEREK